jgi:YihY family inner membrane protein
MKALFNSDFIKKQIGRIGGLGNFLMYQFRFWPICWRQIKTSRADQQAAALAYNTIFGFIPLLIVMLIVFQSVPAYEGIGETIQSNIFSAVQLDQFQYADPDKPGEIVMLSDYVGSMVSEFFEKTHAGAMTIVSLLFVFWAAVKLLTTVEKAFNNIWDVTRMRPLVQRIFYYWTILTLGPLIVGAGLYLKTAGVLAEHLYGVVSVFGHFGNWGWLFTLVSFYLLFWSMPNTKVKVYAAFWGALVTTLIWTIVKNIYSYYVFEFEPFKQLYGVLALIPITILWINILWRVILFGVYLSFVVQNFKQLDVAERAAEEEDKFYYPPIDCAFQVMSFIGESFDSGRGPVSGDEIYRQFDAPFEFIAKLLPALEGAGLIYRVEEGCAGYVPARSTDKISLDEVASVVSEMSARYASPEYAEAAKSYKTAISEITIAQMRAGETEACSQTSSAVDC